MAVELDEIDVKLLTALQDPRIELNGPEDKTICRVFRPLLEQEHGIVFGSEKIGRAHV